MTLMYVWNGLCGVYVAGSSWTTSCSTWNIAVTVEENAAKLSKRTWELKRESSKNKSLLHTQLQQMFKLAAFPPTGWLFSKGLAKYGTVLPPHILDQHKPGPQLRSQPQAVEDLDGTLPMCASLHQGVHLCLGTTQQNIENHPKTIQNPI
jgi:hypothetical protein